MKWNAPFCTLWLCLRRYLIGILNVFFVWSSRLVKVIAELNAQIAMLEQKHAQDQFHNTSAELLLDN